MPLAEGESPSFALQLGSTALALVLVLGLAWLSLRALKRLQQGRMGTGAAADTPQVLRSTGLGPRERLVVVRHRDREYLLGVTAGGIGLIDSWLAGAAPTAHADGPPRPTGPSGRSIEAAASAPPPP